MCNYRSNTMKNTIFNDKIINQLKLQKKYLGVGCAVIAQKSGVSEPTINRILSGKHPSAHFSHVLAIAEVLGVDLGARAKDPELMKREQATKKAKQIMRLVRGNSALEGTATSNDAYKRMINKTVSELMAGSTRALWAE